MLTSSLGPATFAYNLSANITNSDRIPSLTNAQALLVGSNVSPTVPVAVIFCADNALD